MSATGRGKARVAFDYYPTPAWAVWRLLDDHFHDLGFRCDTAGPNVLEPNVLEPNVGDGAIVRAVDQWMLDEGCDALHHTFTGVELRRDALEPGTRLQHHIEGVDFRAWEAPKGCHRCKSTGEIRNIGGRMAKCYACDDSDAPRSPTPFDLTLGNPPFLIAESILRHAFTMSAVTAMLLRVNFLGSEERVPFWREFPRPAIRVIPERISFDGDGSDSDYCAWFIWGSRLQNTDILGTTPLEVRKAHRPTKTPTVPQLALGIE